MAGDEKNV